MRVRTLTALLITALILSLTAGAALAHGGDGGRQKISQEFSDMLGFEWGLEHVVKANVKGHMRGRGGGQFVPGAPLTIQEAAVATVRMMGKERDAMALSAAMVNSLLRFADRGEVAAWAEKHVAYLVQAGLLAGEGSYEPTRNASRLYVTVLLVKALGFDAEARQKMETLLPFRDADRIPAALTGYVAAAVDHALIAGYPESDGSRTFRPDQDVRRVEMAKLLGVADSQFPGRPEQANEVKGTVLARTDSTVTLMLRDREKQYLLDLGAAVFVDGAEHSLSAVRPGMRVEAILDHGDILLLQAFTDDQTGAAAAEVTGTLVATQPASGIALGTIAVSVDGTGQVRLFPVAPNAAFTVRGSQVEHAAVAAGSRVTLRLFAGTVTGLTVSD